MHIIARKRIHEFNQKHPGASEPLERWYRIIKHSNFSAFTELRKTFPSADQVDRFTILNIGGNKYSLISYIVYALKRIYIRHIVTHSEYDKGKWKE